MNKSKQREEGSKQHQIYDDISLLFFDVEIMHGFTDITRDNDAFYSRKAFTILFSLPHLYLVNFTFCVALPLLFC